MSRLTTLIVLLLTASFAIAQSPATVRYLANEGVMVTHEQARILFDPLFGNSYNTYQLVDDDTRQAIFAGRAPYDGVDAVFISHFHGDHFSADDVLRLLQMQSGVRLYAPAQAVAAIRALGSDIEQSVADRMIGLDLEYGDAPVTIRAESLLIEAVHIPHSGWPTARTDVQNLAFRVTLNDDNTVLHLGDADARVVHFEADAAHWEERTVDLALPPYWFFASAGGLDILENHIDVRRAIGIHVPATFADPAEVPEQFQDYELFTQPGEERQLR